MKLFPTRIEKQKIAYSDGYVWGLKKLHRQRVDIKQNKKTINLIDWHFPP